MEKLKRIAKENISYFIIFLILLILTTTIFINKHYPWESADINLELESYGKVIIPGIIIIGSIYFILLNIAKKRIFKLESIFLIIAIPVGILYMIAFPIGTIPDDHAHYLRSWEISLGHLVSEQLETGDGGRELPTNLPKILFNVGEHDYDSYLESAPNESLNDETVFQWFSTASLYSFVCYLPQALGIACARIFTDNLLVMAYAGRIFNFITSITLIYFSIKLLPFKKIMAIVIALLPIVFQEAVSLSPDAITTAISMLLVSYTFYLKYTVERNINKKDIFVLGLLSIILALCKIIYIPICFVIYTIPYNKFKSKKQKYLILTSIILLAFIINLSWLGFASRYLVEYNPGVNSTEQVKFILKNPISYLTVLIRTLDDRIDLYISHLLGDLSIFNIPLSPVFKRILFVILTLCICLDNSKKCNVNNITKIIISLSVILVIGLMFTSLYVQWTPLKNLIVEGIQGRYFIPILILLPYLFNNSYFISDKKISYRYLLIFMVFTNLHALSYIFMYYK